MKWYELPKERWWHHSHGKEGTDFQRQKCYNAENSVKKDLQNNQQFASIKDAQKFADKIVTYQWFKKVLIHNINKCRRN